MDAATSKPRTHTRTRTKTRAAQRPVSRQLTSRNTGTHSQHRRTLQIMGPVEEAADGRMNLRAVCVCVCASVCVSVNAKARQIKEL